MWRQRMTADGVPTGAPEPITSGLGIRHAFINDDGTRIAYSVGSLVANVWRVPILDDREATWSDASQLTFDEAHVEFLDLSPQLDELLLNTNRNGSYDIYVLDLMSGDMSQLTDHTGAEAAPKWSPDAARLTFTSMRSGNRDVWTMNRTGGELRAISPHDAEDWEPDWSPDGSTILFASARGGRLQLFTAPAEGGTAQLFADVRAEWQRFSPSGDRVVFSQRQNFPSLWLLSSETGEAEQLTTARDYTAEWSPSGSHLYFVRISENDESDIWSRSLADGSERRLTNFRGKLGELGYLALASDGETLYFTWEQNSGDIWVADIVYD